MNNIACFAFIVLAAATIGSANPMHSLVRVQRKIEVVKAEEGYQSQLPEVYGIRRCGGQGQFVGFRFDGCSPDAICRIPGDSQPRAAEFEFIPHADADAIGVRFVLLADGNSKKVYERAIADSELQGGQNYLIRSHGAVTDELKGETITFQYTVFRVDDQEVESCAEMDFEIV